MSRDLVREYISYLRVEKGLAQNSLDAYERDLGHLQLWSDKNGLDLLSLTRTDLREWLIDLGGGNLAGSSKRRLVSAVRGFYKFLMFEGHIPSSPAEDLVAPQKDIYLPKFLNGEDIEKLINAPDVSNAIGLRDRAMLEIMYATGLRVSETANIKIGDIDLDAGILTTTGKGSKTRKVPVGSSAIEWVKNYLAADTEQRRPVTDRLFVSANGAPLNRGIIYQVIRSYAEKCGLEGVSPHTLRHSFATHLVQNDADIRSVQQMLGHVDISTTQVYTHITSQQLKRNYERFHPRSRSK